MQRAQAVGQCPRQHCFQSTFLPAKLRPAAQSRTHASMHTRPKRLCHGQCAGFTEAAAATDSEQVLRRVKQQFENRAAGYDQDNTYHPRLAKHLLSLCELQPGQHVLDLATGTGLIALQAAAAVGPTGSVTGVDISPGMLEQAKRKYQSSVQLQQQPNPPSQQQSLAQVDFILGDIEDLDSCLGPDLRCRYDVITCSAAVPFLRDPLRTIRDWKLWLKPSGRLVFNAFESMQDYQTFVRMARMYGLKDERDPSELLGKEQRCQEFMQLAGYSDVQVEVETIDRWYPAETIEAHAESIWRTAFSHDPFGDPDRLQQLGDQQQAFRDAFVAAIVEDVTSTDRYDAAGARVFTTHVIYNSTKVVSLFNSTKVVVRIRLVLPELSSEVDLRRGADGR